jgi:hypothetical protein
MAKVAAWDMVTTASSSGVVNQTAKNRRICDRLGVTEEDQPTLYGTAAGATVQQFPGAASIFVEPPGRSIFTDEKLFAEFVSNTPRTTEIYLRYRRSGIPPPWPCERGLLTEQRALATGDPFRRFGRPTTPHRGKVGRRQSTGRPGRFAPQ